MNLGLAYFSSLRRVLLAAAAAAAAILGAALIGQYGFDLYPCELCLYQRYPYAAVIVLGLAGAWWVKSPRGQYWAAHCCGLLFLADVGIAFYHAGVEWGIFPGPSGCSNAGGAGQSLEEMRRAIMEAALVPCDQAMAHVLGLSLAAWNALAAAALAIFVFTALRKLGRPA